MYMIQKGEVVIIILDQTSIIRHDDKQLQIINKLFMQKCKAFEEKYAASRIPQQRLCTEHNMLQQRNSWK